MPGIDTMSMAMATRMSMGKAGELAMNVPVSSAIPQAISPMIILKLNFTMSAPQLF